MEPTILAAIIGCAGVILAAIITILSPHLFQRKGRQRKDKEPTPPPYLGTREPDGPGVGPKVTEFTGVRHPVGTEYFRRPLEEACAFVIKTQYQSDRYHRWRKLADIEVEIEGKNFPGNPSIYLIPSGNLPRWLADSQELLKHPDRLKYKRDTSIRFAQERIGRKLSGAWFYMVKGRPVPAVYCREYDDFLNSGLEEYFHI